MFRCPHVLTWFCPIRSALPKRESYLSTFSKHTCVEGWQAASHVKKRRYEGLLCGHKGGSPLSRETASCLTPVSLLGLDCNKRDLGKAILSSHLVPSQGSNSAKDYSWKYTVQGDLGEKVRAVSTNQDCFINTTWLQPLRRHWAVCATSLGFSSNSSQHFVQHITTSAQSNSTFHPRKRPRQCCSHQIRAFHHQTRDSWRDCLSPENEYRCRQNLGPNLKLYEVDKGRSGTSESLGKNKSRCASVLVSLCSVEGEPAFLFTLRSSTLKGRHKGDVSFAGGKSDPTDRDVVATALREAREELGVDVATERVWGTMKPLRDMSGMMVAPVLANLGPFEEMSFKINPGEVEEIFTLSLSHLCNPKNRGYTHFRTGDKYGYTLPVFRNGKHRVWGLTAVALDHTLKLIVPH